MENESEHLDRPPNTADMARGGSSTESLASIEPQHEGLREPGADSSRVALFPENEVTDLRSRWDSVQASFVDEPRKAVEQADELVAGAMKRLAETFSRERSELESQWDRGDDVSTEDLRVALQRYRAFFARLLAV